MAKKKKKRRKPKQAARPGMMNQFARNIIEGVISGIITAAILKLLGW